MRNQFFYTRTVVSQVEGTEGVANTVTSTFRDSLNLEMVIRSVTLPSGEVVVLLSDMHEQSQLVPTVNPKNNKVTHKEGRVNVQSEITLSVEDGKRFFEVTNVEFSTISTTSTLIGTPNSSDKSGKSSKTKMSVTE